MLSEFERRRLAEIESSLRTEDPTFLGGFPLPPTRGPGWRVLVVVVCLTVGGAVIAQLTGFIAAAVVAWVVAGASVAVRLTRSRRS